MINIQRLAIEINLRTKKGKVLARTPHAHVELERGELLFLAQGLAFDPVPYKLTGDQELCAELARLVQSRYCLGHHKSHLSPFIRNYFLNKLNPDTDRRDTDTLFQRLNGTTRVLFCGAGPSLAENWGLVKWCLETGYALVVAGGSAIKAFELKGLIPDLCITCDPNEITAARGSVSPSFSNEALLFASSGTHPALLKNWGGPICLGHGSSSAPLHHFLEPTKKVIMEGGIGVSTLIFNICEHIKVKELILLGVDLCPTRDGKLYDLSLPFDNQVDAERNKIWEHEAMILGEAARVASFKVKNASLNGRNIPNTATFEELTAKNSPLTEKCHRFERDLPVCQQKEDLLAKSIQFYEELLVLDYTKDLVQSKLYKPFIQPLHEIYMARQLFTGEFPNDSLVIRLEYLKGFFEDLFSNRMAINKH